MNYICGFYAVNQKHCVIKGHCVVCNKKVLDKVITVSYTTP